MSLKMKFLHNQKWERLEEKRRNDEEGKKKKLEAEMRNWLLDLKIDLDRM